MCPVPSKCRYLVDRAEVPAKCKWADTIKAELSVNCALAVTEIVSWMCVRRAWPEVEGDKRNNL